MEIVRLEDPGDQPQRQGFAGGDLLGEQEQLPGACSPTNRGSDHTNPMSPDTPTFKNAVANLARLEANRKSHAHAHPSAAPAHPPSMAAIVTCGIVCSRVDAWYVGPNCSNDGSPVDPVDPLPGEVCADREVVPRAAEHHDPGVARRDREQNLVELLGTFRW